MGWQLEEILTEENHERIASCLDTEARGDADAALDHFLVTAHVVGCLHLHHLRAASRASDDAVDAEAIAAADPIRFDVYASARGVRLGIGATYPGDRLLSGRHVTLGGNLDERLDFWSEKYDDHYPKPDPFPVAAGTRVLLERGVTAVGLTLAAGREGFHGPGWSPWSPTVRCGARSRRTAG